MSERGRSMSSGGDRLLVQGELEEACAVAHEALAATEHLGSYMVLQQLSGVRQHFVPHQRTAVAAAFMDSLDEALRERLWLHLGGEHHEVAGAASPP